MYYNIIDVELVLDLLNSQKFLSIIYLQSTFINKSITTTLNSSSARILASLMNLYLYRNHYWLSKTPSNILLPKPPDTYNIEEFCKYIKEVDTCSIDMKELLVSPEIQAAAASSYGGKSDSDNIYLDVYGSEVDFVAAKGFGGGANAAISGCYKNLASLDFTSLYPSIILNKKLDFNNVCVLQKKFIELQDQKRMEFLFKCSYVYEYDQLMSVQTFLENINTNAYLTKELFSYKDLKYYVSDSRFIFIMANRYSILNDLINWLIEQRSFYKKQLKDDVTGMAKSQESLWKMLSCAVFGCLGYENFECAAFATAAAITHLARRLITISVSLLNKRNFKTYYIDTDGIIINFTGTRDDLDRLSEDITRSINEPHIHLKPEETYKFGIILSKKKYILKEYDGSLIMKGFMRNAIKPIQTVIKDWFTYLFDIVEIEFNKVLEKTSLKSSSNPGSGNGNDDHHSSYNRWITHLDQNEFVLALFSELERMWLEDYRLFSDTKNALYIDRWSVLLNVNVTSPVKKIREFSREMVDSNIADNRVPVFCLRHQNMEELFVYSVNKNNIDFENLRCDVSSLLNVYWNYVVSFTLAPNSHSINYTDIINRFFQKGDRVYFKDLQITIDVTHT